MSVSPAIKALARYVHNVLLGLDRFGNADLGGSYKETISSRVGRAQQAGKWWAVTFAAPFINCLMGNPNHCLESIGK